MFAPERQQLIRNLVRKHRRLSFTELEKLVDASPATLRRDLSELEQAGEIIRVHGGVLDPGFVRQEATFGERLVRNRAAKRSIARAAAELVAPGATVLIDAGSTCVELGKILIRRPDVRIITHSAALLEAAQQGEAELICVGGVLRRVSGALVGGEALRALSMLRGDLAFLGASGLEGAGATTTELMEAQIKTAFLAAAPRRVLLADFTKWNSPGVVRFAEWTDFNDWITDELPPPADLKLLRTAGIKPRRA